MNKRQRKKVQKKQRDGARSSPHLTYQEIDAAWPDALLAAAAWLGITVEELESVLYQPPAPPMSTSIPVIRQPR
jgi:hypothetical protein